MDDTSPEARRILKELYRRRTPEQNLARVEELVCLREQMEWATVRAQYPGASEKQLFRHIADIRLGKELALQVYGPHE